MEHLLNFVYPPRCAACGARFGLDAGHRVCDACLSRIERLPDPICVTCGGPLERGIAEGERCAQCAASPPHFSTARAIARYRPSAEGDPRSMPAMLRRHKYGLDQSLHLALAEFLGPALPFHHDDCDVLMPIPLHRSRIWWRGFNQAALLAFAVGRRIERPVDFKSLVRLRATTPQTYQTHDERKRNVRRAFEVKYPDRVKRKRILLVDDVMTTGATADECARVLIRAGAVRVDVMTLARVL